MQYREYSTPAAVPTSRFRHHPNKSEMYLPVHQRPRRLPNVNYASADCWCFVTYNLHPQCESRLLDALGGTVWRTTGEELEKLKVQLAAIVMMPDHVHALLAPSGTGQTVSDVVCRLKSQAFKEARKSHSVSIKWQESFYDHVLREEERRGEVFEKIANYIFENPAKAGLGENYPFKYRAPM